MEGKKLSLVHDQTNPFGSSYSSAPSTGMSANNVSSLFLSEIDSSLSSQQVMPFSQIIGRNQHMISPQFFLPSPSPLHPVDSLNGYDTHMAPNSSINQLSFAANSSSMQFDICNSQSVPVMNNRYLYSPQMQTPPLHPSIGMNHFSFESQPYNPYHVSLNSSPYSMDNNNNLDFTYNNFSSFQNTKRSFQCDICHAEFPTAQAFGGHMSSHSKAKKKREKLEKCAKDAKKARSGVETPSSNLSKMTGEEQLVQVSKDDDDVVKNGKYLKE